VARGQLYRRFCGLGLEGAAPGREANLIVGHMNRMSARRCRQREAAPGGRRNDRRRQPGLAKSIVGDSQGPPQEANFIVGDSPGKQTCTSATEAGVGFRQTCASATEAGVGFRVSNFQLFTNEHLSTHCSM